MCLFQNASLGVLQIKINGWKSAHGKHFATRVPNAVSSVQLRFAVSLFDMDDYFAHFMIPKKSLKCISRRDTVVPMLDTASTGISTQKSKVSAGGRCDWLWCASHENDWQRKCKWKRCIACSECTGQGISACVSSCLPIFLHCAVHSTRANVVLLSYSVLILWNTYAQNTPIQRRRLLWGQDRKLPPKAQRNLFTLAPSLMLVSQRPLSLPPSILLAPLILGRVRQ